MRVFWIKLRIQMQQLRKRILTKRNLKQYTNAHSDTMKTVKRFCVWNEKYLLFLLLSKFCSSTVPMSLHREQQRVVWNLGRIFNDSFSHQLLKLFSNLQTSSRAPVCRMMENCEMCFLSALKYLIWQLWTFYAFSS